MKIMITGTVKELAKSATVAHQRHNMSVCIEGSPKEMDIFLSVLDDIKNEEKNTDLPPLPTELSKNEKINELAEAAERQDNQVLSRKEAKRIVKILDTTAKEALKVLYHKEQRKSTVRRF